MSLKTPTNPKELRIIAKWQYACVVVMLLFVAGFSLREWAGGTTRPSMPVGVVRSKGVDTRIDHRLWWTVRGFELGKPVFVLAFFAILGRIWWLAKDDNRGNEL